MAQGKPISDEVRAKVIAEVLMNTGVNEISRKLKLSKAAVSRIKNQHAPAVLAQTGEEKAARMDELICEHLSAGIRAQVKIYEHVSTAEYIKKQRASEVAELLDKLASTTFRILEAESIEDGDGTD